MDPSNGRANEDALFEEALKCTNTEERAAFVRRACSDDAARQERLEALLAAHFDSTPFLEPPGSPILLQSDDLDPMPNEPDPEPIPGPIGPYKLLERIDEGGCGVVYVADQAEPIRRRVALKVIKPGVETKVVIARFEAERQALAMMDHPNIARVLDAGTTEAGLPYFVMELVRGIRITEYCDTQRLAPRDRLDLFIQVCRAVEHAHQKGIIHRDIKPSNILVTVHDGVPVSKVIDFGIAKATQGLLTDKTVYTAFQQFIGTPDYMSPEQAEMTALGIDTRSDIYSLGVLLYELLTGKTPFDTKKLLEAGLDAMRRAIREKEPARPSTRLSTMMEAELTTTAKRRRTEALKLIHLVSGDLDWIVMKCLEKDRTRRYATAEALAADLARHLKDELVVARPPTAFYKFQKAFRRNRLVFLSAMAGAALLIGAIALTTSLWLRAEKATGAKESARNEAAQLINRLFEMHNDLRPLGRLDVLAKPAAAAAKYLDSLPPDTMDARSRAQSAILARQLGELAQMRGKNPEAVAFFKRAVELARQAWQEDKSHATACALGAALIPAADLRFALNSGDSEFHPLCNEVLVLSDSVLKSEPEDFDAMRLQAMALERLGWADRVGMRLDSANDKLESAVATNRKLAGLRPSDISVWRQQWIVVARLADTMKMRREYADAERLLREACEAFLDKAQKEPASLLWQIDRNNFEDRLADLLSDSGKAENALPLQESVLARWRTLRPQTPEEDVRVQRGTNLAREKIGLLLLDAGRSEDAATHIAECLRTAEEISRRPSPEESWIRDAIMAHELAGRLALARAAIADRTGNRQLLNESIKHFRQSLAHAQKLAERTGAAHSKEATLYHQLYLARAQWQLGAAEGIAEVQEPGSGVARIREALKILREAQEKANGILPPSRSSWENDMQAHIARLAPPP